MYPTSTSSSVLYKKFVSTFILILEYNQVSKCTFLYTLTRCHERIRVTHTHTHILKYYLIRILVCER